MSNRKKPLKIFLDWVNGEYIIGQSNTEYKPDKEDITEIPREKKHHEKGFTEQLEEWVASDAITVYRKLYKVMSVCLSLIIIACMLIAVSELPSFGDPNNPANNEVALKYITDALGDTGAVNVVGGMILDYRAFDTFGESTVLFIAAGAVIILLRNDKKKKGREDDDVIYEPKPDDILRVVSSILIPLVLVFGIYIVLNGHISPGGGFSGGTVMGAGLILFYNAFGSKEVQRFFTYKVFNTVTVSALGFYALAKSYSFYTGANHIKSIIPIGTPGDILSSGLILPLNICVGVIVACTMFGFYSLFNREGI